MDFDEHALKRQSTSAQRLIKYSSSEGDQVFLLPLKLSPFFGDFFEVVLQATSAMFVTNYPRGYTKVGFCYSQTEKSLVNRLKFEHVRNRGDFVATSCHEIAMKSPLVYTGDLESPQKSPQKLPLKSPQKSPV